MSTKFSMPNGHMDANRICSSVFLTKGLCC